MQYCRIDGSTPPDTLALPHCLRTRVRTLTEPQGLQYCRIDGNTSTDAPALPPSLPHACVYLVYCALTLARMRVLYCTVPQGQQYCRIDGNTSTEDREEQIDAYNKPGSEKVCNDRGVTLSDLWGDE
jgi:hypothetical protein